MSTVITFLFNYFFHHIILPFATFGALAVAIEQYLFTERTGHVDTDEYILVYLCAFLWLVCMVGSYCAIYYAETRVQVFMMAGVMVYLLGHTNSMMASVLNLSRKV